MSKKDQLSYTVENGVMTITIDNPEMKNGLNYIGINLFADAMEELNRDESIKVCVIRGSHGYFFTGGRVDPNNPGENDKYADAIDRYERSTRENQKPIIAAVNGNCLKAGLGVVCNADFAIALEGVEFGLPEIRMGGVPMMVMVQTMDYLPKKLAMEAYLTAWNFSAQRALEIGIVNRVVSEADFDATVQKFVDVFLNTHPELIRLTRKAYKELSKFDDFEERSAFGMNMLRNEVLPTMQKVKQEYNV